jgi:hypothetical protein
VKAAERVIPLIPRGPLRSLGSRKVRRDISSDPSYRGQLGEGTEGPRGRGQGGSSLEGAGKGRLWRKGSRKGID